MRRACQLLIIRLGQFALLLFVLVLTLLLASCTIVHHPTAGTYASLGGDTSKLQADQSGFTFAANNNSVGMEKAGEVIQGVVKIEASRRLIGAGINAAQGVATETVKTVGEVAQ